MKAIATCLLGLGVVVWAAGCIPGAPDKESRPEAGGAKPTPAPELTGATEWLNTKPLKLADQKGKVVVVHFWTNGCINCVHNYPHYRSWQDRYKDTKNFLLVGVHTPEFEAEKGADRIKDRMAKNKLTFAVAIDNDKAVWKAWDNEYWPCIYVIDAAGNVRHKHEGELGDDGYKATTKVIDDLLAEAPPGDK